ncbi:hypothetical protein PLESTB_000207400 [Pleodorina starrii]|uniref:Uncharacterized protein n=1 Tax=Pleodorina starrii TaxID=330485 RepID=A0A9W6BCL9_9CHLO|nr:hypothetical protein PLESTB_000207400 [Pleodorina starrii]
MVHQCRIALHETDHVGTAVIPHPTLNLHCLSMTVERAILESLESATKLTRSQPLRSPAIRPHHSTWSGVVGRSDSPAAAAADDDDATAGARTCTAAASAGGNFGTRWGSISSPKTAPTTASTTRCASASASAASTGTWLCAASAAAS